jgi:hypothetical protein
MLRISRDGICIMFVTATEVIEEAISEGPPGRFAIEDVSADQLPFGQASRRWGFATKHEDGSVVIQPDPWQRAPAR